MLWLWLGRIDSGSSRGINAMPVSVRQALRLEIDFRS